MRFFDNFEQDLAAVNDLNSLQRVMRAYGIEKIEVDNNTTIVKVNRYGLLENVPQEAWDVKIGEWDAEIIAKNGNITAMHNVASAEIEEFIEKYGLKHKVVEEE